MVLNGGAMPFAVLYECPAWGGDSGELWDNNQHLSQGSILHTKRLTLVRYGPCWSLGAQASWRREPKKVRSQNGPVGMHCWETAWEA